MNLKLTSVVCLSLILPLSHAAQAEARNAPKDKPVGAKADEVSRLEKAIAPYIAKGRETYPEARSRYLTGLPQKHVFFVMVRLSDNAGKFELVFLRVRGIDQKKTEITGLISNEIAVVEGYHLGQQLTLPEDRILDWLISHPDGSEEGNVVGKFLDTYKDKKED